MLGKVFFPSGNPGAQLIATFWTFAGAFLLRACSAAWCSGHWGIALAASACLL
ncbi:MAG: hypothetical protein CBARDMAM_6984 [uncultured Caballeronia sp.]|nr:MAG: hypothetical protein CBARDMAM_6984 [uncultured Caballeronia sp.]